MTAKIDMKEIEQKTFRYIEQDGLMEIMMGLLFIGVGMAFDTPFTIFPIIIAFFLFPRFILVLRKRFTYPRIGYAKLPQDDQGKTGKSMIIYIFSVAAFFVICLILFGDVKDTSLYRKWSPTLFGVVLLGAFNYLYSKSGSLRYWIYALVILGFGILFSIRNYAGYEGVITWILSMGVFFLITGLVYFVLFLHRYPMPAEEVTNGED